MFNNKKALLLDMNSTFMFGEDRFGEGVDYSDYYYTIGGTLSKSELDHIIRSTYDYLDQRYPDENYRNNFPSLYQAIENTLQVEISPEEIDRVIDTFAFHERGHIPQPYIDALHDLSKHFILALVIDIWAPKETWIKSFEDSGIDELFSAMSFSSDHGMVKPSPKPFEQIVTQLKLQNKQCLVIGDSVRRDLGGAVSAGIDCVLVGGASAPDAAGCYPNLLAFSNEIMKHS